MTAPHVTAIVAINPVANPFEVDPLHPSPVKRLDIVLGSGPNSVNHGEILLECGTSLAMGK